MKKILFVNSGTIEGEKIYTSSFVQSQAKSLQNSWKIVWGLTGWASTSPKQIFSNIARLRELSQKENVTLVHAQYGSINSFIALCASRGKPFVVSFCGDDVLGTIQPGVKWRIREFVAKWLSFLAAAIADHIIVKSLNIKGALPRVFKEKISIIPNGVDTTFFAPSDQKESRIILGLSENKRYVLFNYSIGNNLMRKNKPLADLTMGKVKNLYPDAELLIVGNVSYSLMSSYINAADVVLLTSIHEGSPNIIKEAMACNVPVVSVQCGDVQERITNDSVGYVCSYDADELAAKIILILENNQRSDGRAHLLKQELSTDQVREKVEAVYNKVLMS